MLCPGSLRLSELAPEEKPSEESQMGQRCHLALAGGSPILSEEEAELVERCRTKLPDILAGMKPHTELFEEPVSLIDGKNSCLTEGTCDYLAISDDKAVVVDWKFGYQAADSVSSSIQIGVYGACVRQRLGLPVRGYMYQPRFDSLFEADIPSPEEAIGWVESLVNCAADSLLLRPSPEACTYCPALAICHAPRCLTSELKTAITLEDMTSADLGRLANFAKVAEKQAKIVLEETKRRLKDGLSVPGWKLVPRQTWALVEDRNGGAA